MPTSLPSWNAAAMAVVVLALGRAAHSRGAGRLTGATEVAGLAAAGLPLVQCALGLLLAGRVAPGGDSSAAALSSSWSAASTARRYFCSPSRSRRSPSPARRTLPAWTVYPNGVLAVALTGSGFGYLLLSLALAWAVYVSLPVLLIWMADAGPMLARAMR